jgi:hypothetical protein
MPAVCLPTEPSLIRSRWATAALEPPSAIRHSTALSRSVSEPTPCRRELRTISLPTTSGSITVPPPATTRSASTNWPPSSTRSLSR